MARVRFHLAFPVRDLQVTRQFYVDLLGCQVGRESDSWIDFDFFDHQITAHLTTTAVEPVAANPVDSDAVPVRHFGVILGCFRVRFGRYQNLTDPQTSDYDIALF